jgi:hypothetical protein
VRSRARQLSAVSAPRLDIAENTERTRHPPRTYWSSSSSGGMGLFRAGRSVPGRSQIATVSTPCSATYIAEIDMQGPPRQLVDQNITPVPIAQTDNMAHEALSSVLTRHSRLRSQLTSDAHRPRKVGSSPDPNLGRRALLPQHVSQIRCPVRTPLGQTYIDSSGSTLLSTALL